MYTDRYNRNERKPSNLLLETALVVLVFGIGIGIFNSSTGFNNMSSLKPDAFQGFKTVNVSRINAQH